SCGAMGHIRCHNAEKGDVIWEHNLPRKYRADVPIWGYSGHLLIFKTKVYRLEGGGGSVPAFAAKCAFVRNGKEIVCVDLAE
ncbi:MAG: hypothetical protein VCA35_02620, partial [Roseibacillus sp.]